MVLLGIFDPISRPLCANNASDTGALSFPFFNWCVARTSCTPVRGWFASCWDSSPASSTSLSSTICLRPPFAAVCAVVLLIPLIGPSYYEKCVRECKNCAGNARWDANLMACIHNGHRRPKVCSSLEYRSKSMQEPVAKKCGHLQLTTVLRLICHLEATLIVVNVSLWRRKRCPWLHDLLSLLSEAFSLP